MADLKPDSGTIFEPGHLSRSQSAASQHFRGLQRDKSAAGQDVVGALRAPHPTVLAHSVLTEDMQQLTVVHDGQDYRLQGVHDHIKPDGTTLALLEWATQCPDCGAAFVVSTTLIFKGPRRRCDNCKAPGRRVRRKRRSFSDASLSVTLADRHAVVAMNGELLSPEP